MAAQALSEGGLRPYRTGLVVAQIDRTGVSSVLLSAVTGLFAGVGVARQGSVAFGFLVAPAGRYQGVTFTGGSIELGHATTGTVVAIGSALLITGFLLTQLFFVA
jgi:ABC-type transporter Mla maintaining outer membrane lipid asymmetry permease subunit MlaE